MYQFSPSLIKPPRWPIQPHLTAAPELSPYVIAGIAYWGDQYEDFVAGKTAPIQSAITKVVGEVGVGYNIGQSEDSVGGVSLPFNSDRIYTYIATFKAADTSGNTSDFFAQFVGHVDTAFNDGAILNIDSGGRAFVATLGGNTNGDNGNAKVVDDGSVHTIALTFDQVNNRMIQSVDGQIDYNVSYSDTSSQSNAVFGLAPNAERNDSDVTVFSQYILETPFQPAEILLNSITTDPFAMLRPGPQLLPLLFGGAGATGSNQEVFTGLPVESETTLQISGSTNKAARLGVPFEYETALDIAGGPNKAQTLSLIKEVESAFSVEAGSTLTADLGLVQETEVAFALEVSVVKGSTLGLASEDESALPITIGSSIGVVVGLIVESEAALAPQVLVEPSVTLELVQEFEGALSLQTGSLDEGFMSFVSKTTVDRSPRYIKLNTYLPPNTKPGID